jgi:histidinol-phosphate aminotransferase
MIETLIRPHIRQLKAYSSARSEYTGDAVAYLDANENPFSGFSEKEFNRYPDPLQKQIKRRLAVSKGLDVEQIFLGNGSDECLDVLMRTVVEPLVESVCICPPTYGMYEVLADIHRAEVRRAFLTNNFALDIEAITEAVDENTKILFLCSPNNPTGNILATESIEKLLETFKGIVLIDEAYVDFSTSQSWILRLNKFPRLVVCQTFSKAAGLAGLRLGMLFGDPLLIAAMNKVKYPYNINFLTQKLACQYLDKADAEKKSLNTIIRERDNLALELTENSNVVQVHNSSANFLLVEFKEALKTFEALRANGIIVRNRTGEYNCKSCLRITVGTPKENRLIMEVINSI